VSGPADLTGTETVIMALILLGGGVASASGSLGGTTFSRNRGGPYMRTRAIPVNPATSYQQAARQYVADLTSKWLSVLTAVQRAAWDTYAANVELPGPLGNPRNVGGIAMYVRSNVPRLVAGMPRVDAAPTVFNLGDYTAPGPLSASEATQQISVAFDNTDDWAGEDDAALLCSAGPALNASINSTVGHTRFYNGIDGDSVTPPTSPVTEGAPFPFLEGQRIRLFFRVTRADGRLSSPFRALVNCAS
jgi:hypothetical protein